MTKDKLIETLKMAQDALHMATLPFPIDQVKTQRALEAVDDALDAMPLFSDWPGGFPFKPCILCANKCNEGRDCPTRNGK